MYDSQAPFIASYIIIKNGNKVAFILRANTKWMNGYYSLPSGKVELTENFTDCAIREGLEEAGVKINRDQIKPVHIAHRYTVKEMSYWVDVYFEVLDYEGEAHNAEPEMHSDFQWFALDGLPENVIPSVKYALEEISKGKIYSEFGWADTPTAGED